LKLESFFIYRACQCDRDLAPSSSGSLRWTAPEVLKQGGIVSMRSDIWSFGMLCLEILSGDVPFISKTDDGVRHQLEQSKHPERPGRSATSKGLDAGMWNLMCRCWEKNPEQRPSMKKVKPYLLNIRGSTSQTCIV
jgi:son of sevenless-like protein